MYKRTPMEKEMRVSNLFLWTSFRLYNKVWRSLSVFNSLLDCSPIFWKGEGRRLNKDRINTSPQTKLCWSLSLQHPVHAHPFPVVHVKHVKYNFHFIVHFSVHFVLRWPENLQSITVSTVEIKLVPCARRKVKGAAASGGGGGDSSRVPIPAWRWQSRQRHPCPPSFADLAAALEQTRGRNWFFICLICLGHQEQTSSVTATNTQRTRRPNGVGSRTRKALCQTRANSVKLCLDCCVSLEKKKPVTSLVFWTVEGSRNICRNELYYKTEEFLVLFRAQANSFFCQHKDLQY